MCSIPLVSIVCETYNHEKYVRDCLEGFLMQKVNFEYEILIHDDASKDGTQAIIREYESRYPDKIKPIYQTENQYSKGVKIWNKIQFPRARGKYIALCEGDDYWIDPHKLQRQVDFLESHPDYSMTFHAAMVHHQDDSRSDHIFAPIESREYDIRENMGDHWIVATASLVFRASVYNSPYFTAYKQSEKIVVGDYPLIQTCAKEGRLYGFSDVMSVYRLQSGGWTQQRNLGTKMAIKLIEQELEYRRIFGGYQCYITPRAVARHSRAAVSLLFKGKIADAFKIWCIAIPVAPWLVTQENFKFIVRLICHTLLHSK